MGSGYSIFGILLGLMVVVIISAAIVKLGWAMFMIPVFGMKPLTWTQAFGFMFLSSCFRASGKTVEKLIQ